MNTGSKFRKVFTLCLILISIAVHGQINVANSASASADASLADHPATAVNDGDRADGTGWAASSTGNDIDQWLDLTWTSEQIVSKTILFTSSDPDHALRGFDIQYWDGALFRTAATVSGNAEALDHEIITHELLTKNISSYPTGMYFVGIRGESPFLKLIKN